ncbi:MAG: HEAT repeat domain-containing protein [Planctomycetes bacterium]|nr:HEAT repeat domain-containing protein [Planctomycetota bacterium]
MIPTSSCGAAPKPDDKRWFEKLFQAVMPDLLSNLEHPVRSIRLTAVETLENLGPDAYAQAPVLVKSLADPDQIVRWATARALGRIDGTPVPGEIEALGRALSDRDLSVRVAAAATLEGFGSQAAAAVPALLRAVNVGDADARIAVLRALGAIGKDGKQVVPVVARALVHPDRRVRRAAAETIGRFGADAVLAADALERAVRDVDPEVRRFASEAALNIPLR